MKKLQFSLATIAALTVATLPMACGESSTSPGNAGTLVVKLTDAPFLTDSVSKVEIYVVRVDARTGDVTDAEADANLDNGASTGWQTLATPNATINLLTLQNGATTTLGTTAMTAGTYNGFRLIIDPTKSSVTLKNGMVLTGTSNPSITFPSASRSGIKIVLTKPLQIVAGATTTLIVDFNVNDSFVMRGNSIQQNGLLFKPVIRGTIIDAATVNATVRLANATGTALDLLRSGTAVTGGTNLVFGASSACTSVPAATPGLTIANTGTTAALAGFTPTLQPGTTYTVIAYPTATGGVQFVTLANTFTPTASQAGLRVFNATGGTTGYDVFVTASGAPLGTPTIVNALTGAGTSFVSVAAGSQQIRLATTGGTTVALDLGAQTLTAGQNYTLVIAPPAAGSTTLRAFLVTACS